MLRSAIPGQQWSTAPGPSTQRPSVRPYEATTDMSYPSYAPQSSGYDSGYGTHVPSAPSAEALRKQQEEFVRNAELRQTLANLEKVNDEGRRTSLLDTLCSTEDVLNLPEHPNPPGIASGELRVDLLRHQVCDYSIMQ
jgi:SWI/SNF-related matrix-associated actin-dependent regulator of chromatin subfamily A3